MKAIVCGAGGYVGKRLVNYLLEKLGMEVCVVTRKAQVWDDVEQVCGDLRDPAVAKRAVAGAGWVFNLAANVGGIGYIGKQKAECMLSSVINANLLSAAQKEKNLAGYFFASSSCVYPEKNHPLTEDDAYPAAPMDGYGWEKLFSERMCQAFGSDYKMPVRIGRYHTIYGPGDVRPEGRDHVTAALCKKVVEAKLSGKHEINIWGDGNQTRSFLYIDDCIEGTYRIMNGISALPMNLGNAEIVSVNGLVTMLEEIAAVKLTRFYSADAPTGLQHKQVDNTLIRNTLHWEPMTPIHEGLRRMYNDFYDRALIGKK
jgi:GDP-D-mannose 3',5'-epimerase